MNPRLTSLCTLALLTSANTASTAQAPLARRPRPASESKPTDLPVTRVALYKNGVGFFEHAGRVAGDQAITIDFTSAQLNDVLQSLTAIDLQGGRITGAGYNSTTPLEQQLKSLPLALGADADSFAFYNALRGARVEVHSGAISITGRLLSIEARAVPPKENQPDAPANQVEKQFLTVVSDAGAVRTLELTPATEVRLLDSALHTDVTRYLELLASTRNAGLRHLTLEDRGTGARDLRVSYISEVPVWKSTYRILFTDGAGPAVAGSQTATLQGWSVVDNTTGSDWLNVHLSLIAGAPQSFIQPLSTPYYTRRPEIPLPAEAQLSPQTHESGDSTDDKAELTQYSALAPPPTAMARSSKARVVGMGGTTGGAAGVMGGVAGGYGSASETVTVHGAAPMMETSAQSIGGPIAGTRYQQLAAASIAPGTSTSAFDDYFEYSLTDPITIRKNESALVPILQTKLPVERVTLWSQSQPIALRALWITNASTLTLDRGSFSIVENGNFGGEGLLDPIHPDERRLLSYAADQAVRVSQSNFKNDRRIQHLKISKGVLTETSTDINERTYDVRNAAPEARTVVIEHPVRPGWELSGAGGDPAPKPAEATPAVDRFKLTVAPAHTEHLHVAERHTNFEYIRLVDRTEDQLVLLLRNAKASPAALAALQPAFDAHHAVAALDDRIRAADAEIASITQDQNRLRENLKSLKGTPEEKALATRYTGELNAQEDRLDQLRKQLVQLRTDRAAADQTFQDRLEAVNLDESL